MNRNLWKRIVNWFDEKMKWILSFISFVMTSLLVVMLHSHLN